jgi:hypothetical protein
MKTCVVALALSSLSLPALATDTGVSVTVGQPGFYGHIEIGNLPHPQVINAEPVLVHPNRHPGTPIYLHVPPGHAKHWDKHCAEYDACSRRVHFVQEDWYNNVYVPRYQSQHPKAEGSAGRTDENGPGNGNGNGNGHGHGKGHGMGHGHNN